MSKPWGKIGAWAAEAEREEEEAAEAAALAASAPESKSFPSLKESVTAKPKKKKMTLSEFTGYGAPSGGGSKGLTPDEMIRLPTGPKERSAEEMQYSRLGGGFSSYGRSGPPPGRRDSDQEGSWGAGRRSYGGFDDDRRGPPSRGSDFDQPSRADEVDNWASMKKSQPSFGMDSGGRNNRYSSLGGGIGGEGGSRADEVDNWAAGKKAPPVRSSTFGSGFRDSGPEPDRWSRGGGLRDSGERERPRLVLDPPRGEVAGNEPRTNKSNPFGAARPREEVLAEKGLDWKKLDSDIDAKKTSRPTSSHSSRPSSAQSSRSEGPALQGIDGGIKPRPKVNPFGDAKPREVLLEEKGKDWRKIDLELEHRGVDRAETEEEKILKEEINHLKKELGKESGGGQPNLQDVILDKERELELLIRDLDDKVRFGQKAIERPGSGAGRVTGFLERPPSQSGRFEDSRSMDMERPRSRGTVDVWRAGDDRRSYQGGGGDDRRSYQGGGGDDRRSYQGGGGGDDRRSYQGGGGDDRRSYQGGGGGGRERGFLGNRDMDRPRSRERW